MRMRWYNILNGRCPKCDSKLVDTGVGLECLASHDCKFFITTERAKALKQKIKDDRYKRRVDRSGIRP